MFCRLTGSFCIHLCAEACSWTTSSSGPRKYIWRRLASAQIAWKPFTTLDWWTCTLATRRHASPGSGKHQWPPVVTSMVTASLSFWSTRSWLKPEASTKRRCLLLTSSIPSLMWIVPWMSWDALGCRAGSQQNGDSLLSWRVWHVLTKICFIAASGSQGEVMWQLGDIHEKLGNHAKAGKRGEEQDRNGQNLFYIYIYIYIYNYIYNIYI